MNSICCLIILFTHNLVINAMPAHNSFNRKSIFSAIRDRRFRSLRYLATHDCKCNWGCGHVDADAIAECLCVPSRKNNNNNNNINITPHPACASVWVCAAAYWWPAVRKWCFSLKGKILILHALQFLAHFNYANGVYVETNSHCLPAALHIWTYQRWWVIGALKEYRY